MGTPKNNSVFKAFDILNVFGAAGRPLSTAEIAEATGLAPPTAHRFLLTLEDVGAVTRGDDSKFRLGFLMAELGRHADHPDVLADRARGPVEALATELRETVTLAAFENGVIRSLVFAEPARPFAFAMRKDQHFPLHATAFGKLFVAALAPLRREELMGELELEPFTARTLTDISQLRHAVRAVSELGFAEVREELEEGLNCVAVPLKGPHGTILAALAVSAPSSRLPRGKLDDVVKALRAATAKIGKGLFIEARTLPHKAQPLGQFPHVKRVDNMAFVSGTSARLPDNSFAGVSLQRGLPPIIDVEIQTRETLTNVCDILNSVGATLSDVVQMEAFLTDVTDLGPFQAGCDAVLGDEDVPIQAIAATALPHPHQAIMVKAAAITPFSATSIKRQVDRI
ncbi:MAG: IclR family transcriptional regulator C-terminal domain-containing protein [Pseudomonadota bacterium]